MSVQQSKLRSKISLGGGSSSSQPHMEGDGIAEDSQGSVADGDYRNGADYRSDPPATDLADEGPELYDADDDFGAYAEPRDPREPADGHVADMRGNPRDVAMDVPPAPGHGATDASADAGQTKKRAYKRASIAFLGIFIVSGTLLALMLGTNWLKNQAYVDLSSDIDIEMKDNTTDAKGMEKTVTPGRDWNALLSENGDLKYWMTVENKPIDYPLVQHPTDQNYYLKHDFWGGYDVAGTPFIDVRNYLSDKHLLTYGHHITGSTTMYSTVNKAWDPDELAEIGKLTLESPTENGNTNYEVFYPAYGFMVDQSYQEIQTFDFDSDTQFRTWLKGMADTASAKNEHTDYLCRNARRAVSFVTCASDTPNQRQRTIIMFISVAAPSTSYEDACFLPQDIAVVTSQTEQQIQQQQQAQQVQRQAQQQAGQGQADASAAGQSTIGNQQVATRLNLVGLLSHGTGTATLGGVPSSPLLEGSVTR